MVGVAGRPVVRTLAQMCDAPGVRMGTTEVVAVWLAQHPDGASIPVHTHGWSRLARRGAGSEVRRT
jgi:hypothetical protein